MKREFAVAFCLIAATHLAAAEKPLSLNDLDMQQPASANAALQKDLETRSSMLKWHQWVGIAAIELCRPLPFRALERPAVSSLVSRALTGVLAKANRDDS